MPDEPQGRVVVRLSRDAGTCMGSCASKADLYGRIPKHLKVVEFGVGSFRARLCHDCTRELIASLDWVLRD